MITNDIRYTFLRFPGGNPKAVTFSYDDGVSQDKRLAEIFNKYGTLGQCMWVVPWIR